MSWSFRLRVNVAPGFGVHSDEDVRFVLSAGSHPIQVVAQGAAGREIRRRSRLVMRGEGYDSEDEARAAGEAARRGLRRAAVATHLPVDFGRDVARGGMGSYLRRQIEAAEPVRIRSDVHGLAVFEEAEGREAHFAGMEAAAFPAIPAAMLEAALLEGVERELSGGVEDERISLAADLYLLADFESSSRARLLIMVTALEVLADRKARSGSARALLDRYVDEAREAASASSGVDAEELRALAFALESLRLRSIGSAIRDLIDETVGGDTRFGEWTAQAIGRDLYKWRSALTHEGALAAEEEVWGFVPYLAQLVREVLLRRL